MIEGGRVAGAGGIGVAYLAVGAGATLVVVHGTMSDGLEWGAVAALLRDRFRVVLPDRRGYGRSDSGRVRDLECEAADLLAVIDHLDGPVALLGHSYGGRVALEAAVRARPGAIGRLMLYEPAFSSIPRQVLARASALEEEGRLEQALTLLLASMPGVAVPQRTRDDLRVWGRLVGMARHVIEEAAAVHEIPPDPARYRHLAMPVDLLVGAESPPTARTAEAVLTRVPRLTTTLLDGQGHTAHQAAPDAFAATLTRLIQGG
ncbi:alpha/beta hydrolase [Actinocorallia aurea]